ncbi:MAG: TonB-dependent receptor [Prolixibacteraceae bacterium]
MKKKRNQRNGQLLDDLSKTYRIMKLMCFFLLVTLIQVSASTYSQTTKLSLTGRNLTIEQVLGRIEDQSQFSFFYNVNEVDLSKVVNVDMENVSIESILNYVLDGTGLGYTVNNKLIIIHPSTSSGRDYLSTAQQNKTVKGKVTDSSGTPLPGVSIVINGTTGGTITGTDGNYSLNNIPADAILVFSFVGMESQEVKVEGKTTIHIEMVEDAIGIEEVVAIGYGTVKKQNLTSSVSKIGSEAIESRPIATLSEAFAGQLAGVRAQNTTGIPGSDLEIRIRGINTINGSSAPLYVIDGVAKDDMKDINPSDIESIQILKDASATSIYGSRGANGVVLIETKKGKGKPSINFESYYGLQTAEKKMEVMNADEWMANSIWRRNVQWLRQGGSMSDPMSARPDNLQIPDAWYEYAADGGTDWQDAIFCTAPIQSYQLSASSKNDLGSMYISGGYLDQDGIVWNTYYRRVNFRFNGSLNVSDHIKVGIITAPSFSNQDDRTSEGKELIIHHALLQSPLVPLHSATRDWGYPVGLSTVYPNPREQLRETINNYRANSLNTSVWGEVEIFKGLIFKSQYSYDHRNRVYEFFQPGNVTYQNGNVTLGNSDTRVWNDWSIQNTLIYDKSFKSHSLNILLGQSAEEHKNYIISAAATGWPNENLSSLSVATTPTRASTSKTTAKMASYFGRVSYNFKEKYLLNASMRYDGSSRFGSNNKWGLFPSASAGWKINEESFFKETNWINLLKLRVAWGKAGNDRIGDYAYMSLLAKNNTSWGDAIVSGWSPSNIENPNLRWESTATTDIGIDFTGFNNRVQVNFDYYKNVTDNLLFSVPIPYSTGFAGLKTNLGSVQNTGWEVDLTTYNLIGKFKWTTSFNFSRERNKVLDMGDITQFTSTSQDGQFITRVGGPVAQFYVYRTNGLLTADDFGSDGKALVPILTGQEIGNVKYVNQNDDNVINASDLVPYGNNIPDVIYGITNTFQWKNFEFSALFQGQVGGDVMFLGQRQLDTGSAGSINQFRRWVHSWKPDYESIYGEGENPIPAIEGVDMSWDGKTPSPVGKNDNNDDRRIYDGTFLRIKNITLTYTLPAQMLRRTIFKAARVYTSVDNLVTFDNYPGYSPETDSFGNGTTQSGVDYATYPLSRRFTLGVRVTL